MKSRWPTVLDRPKADRPIAILFFARRYNANMTLGPEPRQFRSNLLAWFDENARDLPWRRTTDPYGIWVSEIMLQQTRVAAVIEHYHRFMERFPTLPALAAANEEVVLACWSGLGYYRRARLLHRAARLAAAEMGGKLPGNSTDLRKLPGIGEYTSAAIASIGFGEAIACVDGNVERVILRLRGWSELDETVVRGPRAAVARIREVAQQLLDPRRPGDFNQAMMELGATVCLPRNPLCLECPVQQQCRTRGEHATAERARMRSRKVAYAFLRREPAAEPKIRSPRALAEETEILLEQRSETASLMPGMWELPELDTEAAESETRLMNLRHSITVTNYYVTICGLEAHDEDRLPKSPGTRQWVKVRDLQDLPLTGLTRKVLKRQKTLPGYTGAGPVILVKHKS